MLQNHNWAKDPFKVQDSAMLFNVTLYKKFIEMVSDSTLLLIFKEYHWLSFSVVAKKKEIHNYLKRVLNYSSPFQLHVCMRLNFLHVYESKPHIPTD